MDLNTHINRVALLNIKQSNHINKELFFVNILYSIKLMELNQALGVKCQTAAMARVVFIILNHFNSYKRNIKNDLMRLYNLQGYTVTRALKTLMENHLIIRVNSKRRTNLGLYVTVDAYQITTVGRHSLMAIEKLFENRLNKMNLS